MPQICEKIGRNLAYKKQMLRNVTMCTKRCYFFLKTGNYIHVEKGSSHI